MMKSYNIDKSKKIKETWDCGSENINPPTDQHQDGADLLHGYPWPPRSYTCSFCKREFRSAQALGGHMNVHRRDRARLRQYSPPKEHGQCTTVLNLNVEPSSPNPNFGSSSSSTSLTKFPPFTSTITSSFSPSCGYTTPTELKTWGKNNGNNVCNINHFNASENVELSKKKVTKTLFRNEDLGFQKGFSVASEEQVVTLGLEIGLVNHKKEELDLELRLGYT